MHGVENLGDCRFISRMGQRLSRHQLKYCYQLLLSTTSRKLDSSGAEWVIEYDLVTAVGRAGLLVLFKLATS